MKRYITILMAFIMFAALAVPAEAAVDLTTPQYVVDDANVLTSALEETIDAANDDLVGNCGGATFTVITVATAPDGVNHKEYARQIFDAWGIGTNHQGNGMLLVLYTEDDSFQLEMGPGITATPSVGELAALTDDNSDFCKYIRQDMDAEAISWLLDQIVVWYYDNYHTSFLTGGYTTAQGANTQPGYTPPTRKFNLGFGKLVLIVLLVIVLTSPLRIYRQYKRWGVWPFVMFSPWWATRPRQPGRFRLRRARPVGKARANSRPGNTQPPRTPNRDVNRTTSGFSGGRGSTNRSTAARSGRSSGFGRK